MVEFTITDFEGETCMTLKPVMDLTVAEDFRLALLDCLARGKNVKLMAGKVERMTTPCLQLLLAYQDRIAHQQINFVIEDMSEPFKSAINDVGLADILSTSEQKK